MKSFEAIKIDFTDKFERVAYYGRHYQLFADVEGRQVHRFCKAVVKADNTELQEATVGLKESFYDSSKLRERLARAMNSDKPGISKAIAEFWIKSWHDGYLTGRFPHVEEINADSPLMGKRAMKTLVDALGASHKEFLNACDGNSSLSFEESQANVAMMGLTLQMLGFFVSPGAPSHIRTYTSNKFQEMKVTGVTFFSHLGKVEI